MVGERLQRLREAHDMSKTELAQKLFVSVQAVAKYEKENSLPSAQSLITISKLFGCSIDYLLGVDTAEPVIDKKMVDNRIVLRELATLTNKQKQMVISIAKTVTGDSPLNVTTSPVRKDLQPLVSMLEKFDSHEIRALQAFVNSTIALRK